MICLNQTAGIGSGGDEFTGPLFGVDYLEWMDCAIFPRLVCAVLLLQLVLFLMSTADEYLTGTLGILCELLELSQQVAGATLLALGNGAPDIFSILAAFTKGTTSHTDLGLGALLGSCMFLLTAVLGLVLVLHGGEEIQVQFNTFGRDVLFVVLAFGMLLLVHVTRVGATLWVGLGFVGAYALYVGTVLYQSRQQYKPYYQVVVDQDSVVGDGVVDDDDDDGEESVAFEVIENHFKLPTPIPTFTTTTTIPAKASWFTRDLYWKKLRLRRQLAQYGKQTSTELDDANVLIRLVKVLALPLEVARTLTVPVPEPESWNRTLVMMHCPCCLFFLWYLFPGGVLPPITSLAIVCSASALGMLAVYLTFHQATAPRNKLVRLALASVAFAMCVLWIYLVASEIVCILNAFGKVLDVNPSIMGLSLLAWGNSIGDLITNLSIARGGLREMAVSACIATPVFQLLFGFGASLMAVSAKYYPQRVAIQLDRFTLPVVLLLVGILLTSLGFAKLAQYRLGKGLGLFLCLTYVGYLGMVMGLKYTL
ncbi:hypothetical protein BASA81_003592 [Batrachochytrium salamandrivorans]|nr:hypothetical protein BASA81_003592 [Batrachochytrium salamandrivorans]